MLTLLPQDGPYYVPYGRPAPLYLGPCATGADVTGCGAVAYDVQASSGKKADLTPFISVTQTRDCSGDSQVRPMVAHANLLGH
jgi:hypothetical protein